METKITECALNKGSPIHLTKVSIFKMMEFLVTYFIFSAIKFCNNREL